MATIDHLIKILRASVGAEAPAAIFGADYKVGLFTGPLAADELAFPSYGRASVPNSTGWTAAAAVTGFAQTANAADALFPTPGEAWGTPTHVGLFDGTGNLVGIKPIPADQQVSIQAGATVKIAAGALKQKVLAA